MLALTRQIDEWVDFSIPGRAHPIRIKVSNIKGSRVRLAIKADADILISRPDASSTAVRRRGA